MISRVGLVAMLFALGAAQEFGSPSAEVPLAETFREGLKQQTLRNLEQHGESIVIMAVGESGLGKTSLLSSLFRTELVWPQTGPNGETTTSYRQQGVWRWQGPRGEAGKHWIFLMYSLAAPLI